MKLKKIISVVLAIISLYLLIRVLFSPVFIIKHIGNIWGFDVENTLALNQWLLFALNSILGIATYFIYANMFSFKKKNRNRAFIVGAFGLVIIPIIFYFITDDYIVNREGTDLKCCALNLNEEYENVPCSWKFHPQSKERVDTCSIGMLRRINNISEKRVKKINFSEGLIFFSRSNKPLVWYYERTDGRYELFDQSGFHPKLGSKLKPIEPHIAQEILKYSERGEVEKIIANNETFKKESDYSETKKVPEYQPIAKKPVNTIDSKKASKIADLKTKKPNRKVPSDLPSINSHSKNTTSKQDIAIYVKENNSFNSQYSEILSQSFSSKYYSFTGLFNNSTLSQKYFNLLFSSNKELIGHLNLSSYSDYLCIGEIKSDNYESKTDNRIISTDISISLSFINLNTGNVVKNINKVITGVGFNKNQSKQNAFEKAAEYISNNSI